MQQPKPLQTAIEAAATRAATLAPPPPAPRRLVDLPAILAAIGVTSIEELAGPARNDIAMELHRRGICGEKFEADQYISVLIAYHDGAELLPEVEAVLVDMSDLLRRSHEVNQRRQRAVERQAALNHKRQQLAEARENVADLKTMATVDVGEFVYKHRKGTGLPFHVLADRYSLWRAQRDFLVFLRDFFIPSEELKVSALEAELLQMEKELRTEPAAITAAAGAASDTVLPAS